ncbi:hypothetical protein [Proteiniphilum saccharofermentans]|uniref:hypothetical protein n=1 Tax=Proteiniphilum saccharofermentans TaxID=1642647 RepID=UPI0028AC1D43|nr:hypothetical protein [Proteiniphilum saccharofermentans]
MKQTKKIEIIEQLSASEMILIKGGFSSNEQVDNQAEAQSSDSSQIIYINGKPYRIEKDGTMIPV